MDHDKLTVEGETNISFDPCGASLGCDFDGAKRVFRRES
ncbi:hypothetical protein GGE45_003949 [Rhizobium aethiopicum]|nr:hypothetical protein [Rhizobium aethiopicum]